MNANKLSFTYLVFTLTALLSLSNVAAANCQSFGETSSDLFDKIEAGEFTQSAEKFLQEGVEFSEREKEIVYKMVAHNEDTDLASVSNWDYILENYIWPTTYSELHLVTFEDAQSGESFDYVWNYPGDNEYGVLFNSKGEAIGEVGDGDLYCF